MNVLVRMCALLVIMLCLSEMDITILESVQAQAVGNSLLGGILSGVTTSLPAMDELNDGNEAPVMNNNRTPDRELKPCTLECTRTCNLQSYYPSRNTLEIDNSNPAAWYVDARTQHVAVPLNVCVWCACICSEAISMCVYSI